MADWILFKAVNNLRLFAPSRVKDDAAKVGPFEFRVEQREHVVVHGSEGGLRLVAESIVKGVDDLLLKVIPARMRLDYRLPVSVGYVKVAKSEDVHLYARRHEGHFRLLVLGDARRGVQRDGVPHHVNGCLVDAMLPQEAARGVGTIHFKTLGCATVFLGKTHVVKHGPDVEQLGIELQFLPQPSQRWNKILKRVLNGSRPNGLGSSVWPGGSALCSSSKTSRWFD